MAQGKRKVTKKFYEVHAEKLEIPLRLQESALAEMAARASMAISAYETQLKEHSDGQIETICHAVDLLDNLRLTQKTLTTIPINLLLWIYICGTSSETRRQHIYESIGKSAYDFSRMKDGKGRSYSIWDAPISRNTQNLIRYSADDTRHKVIWKKELLDELIACACFAATNRKSACESQLIHGLMLDALPQLARYTLPYPNWYNDGLQPYTASFCQTLFPSNVMLFLTFPAVTLSLVSQNVLLSSLRAAHKTRRHIDVSLLSRFLAYFTASLSEDFEKSQDHAALFGNRKIW